MMTKQQALKLFGGNQAELARALGINRQAVWKWKDSEPIPELREKQLRYEIIPNLKKNPSFHTKNLDKNRTDLGQK